MNNTNSALISGDESNSERSKEKNAASEDGEKSNYTKSLTSLNSIRIDGLVLFVVAFTVRMVYSLNCSWLATDSYKYLQIAENLKTHRVFGFTGKNGEILPTAANSFLYSAIVSLVPSLNALLLIQSLLGASTVLLVYYLGKSNFNRRLGLLAAGMLCFSPLTVHFTATVMSELCLPFSSRRAFFRFTKRDFSLPESCSDWRV